MLRGAASARQRGYALVELTLVLLVACLLAVWGVQTLVHRLDDAEAQSAAVWMDAMRKSLAAYLLRYGSALQAADDPPDDAIPGYADWRHPTVRELAAAGLLAPGIEPAIRLTGEAKIVVWRRGACPGDACAVEGLVYGARPLLTPREGSVDSATIAQWLLASQGQGGAVHAADPERLKGASFAIGSAVPGGAPLPPGTVGMAVTAEHLAKWSFLRVGDVRNPDFQGELSVAGNLVSGADATVGGQLVIEAVNVDGSPCVPDGAVSHDVKGGLLVCRAQRWRPVSRGGAGGYSFNSLYGCKGQDGVSTANPLTDDCSCPWHAVSVRIFDTGNRPYPDGRQQVFLCVG